LPLFFTPVKRQKNLLIDGGVVNPVPIAPTFDDETDITIAVNLGGRRIIKKIDDDEDDPSEKNTSTDEDEGDSETWSHRVREFFSFKSRADIGAYDVAYQAFDAMQSTIARQKLAAYPPDLVIEIPRDACGTFDVHRAADMIEMGRTAAERALSG